MPARKENRKLKPGDLVMLDPKQFTQEFIDSYGLGLYIKPTDDGWCYVCWFKLCTIRPQQLKTRVVKVS